MNWMQSRDFGASVWVATRGYRWCSVTMHFWWVCFRRFLHDRSCWCGRTETQSTSTCEVAELHWASERLSLLVCRASWRKEPTNLVFRHANSNNEIDVEEKRKMIWSVRSVGPAVFHQSVRRVVSRVIIVSNRRHVIP